MAQYQGVVLAQIDESFFLVEVAQPTSVTCEGCLQKKQCQSWNGGYSRQQTLEVACCAEVQCKVGDRVQVVVSSGALIRGFFWVYLVPVLGLLVIAAVGSNLSDDSLLVGVIALLSWLLIQGLQGYATKHGKWLEGINPHPCIMRRC